MFARPFSARPSAIGRVLRAQEVDRLVETAARQRGIVAHRGDDAEIADRARMHDRILLGARPIFATASKPAAAASKSPA